MKSGFILICALIVFSMFSGLAYLQAADEVTGKALFESKCSQCHSLSRPLSAKKDLAGWNITTMRMSKKDNSNISQEEAKAIAEYLSTLNNK